MSGERRNRERDIDGMRRGHKDGFCGYLPSFRGQELIKEMEKDNQENVQKVERKGFQGGHGQWTQTLLQGEEELGCPGKTAKFGIKGIF